MNHLFRTTIISVIQETLVGSSVTASVCSRSRVTKRQRTFGLFLHQTPRLSGPWERGRCLQSPLQHHRGRAFAIRHRGGESELAELATRYAMVGVAKVSVPAEGAKA